MNSEECRWVLAFDASCGTCRQISAAVARAAGDRLTVLPLTNQEVQRWRTTAMGPEPPLAPTLLKVRGEQVRAWTGPGMVLPLVRRLGTRPTVRVLQSLGHLRREAAGHPLTRVEDGIGRKAFLRLGAGAAVAAGLVVAGKAPAFAEQSRQAAQTWVEANKGRLPVSYDAIIEYPTAYRRAIYTELSPAARSRFWLAHLKQYRAAHPDLTPGQLAVLDRGSALAAKPSTFVGDGTSAADERLKEAAVREFGMTGAVAIFATLGPSDHPLGQQQFGPLSGCTCNREDDWCGLGYHCRLEGGATCQESSSGCGWWGGQRCNGLCYD
jgi:hypothetical protein